MQLDEVRKKLKFTTDRMEKILIQANTQDSFTVNRDKAFGSRAFNFRIIWDDFSPTSLEEKLRELRLAYDEYKALRQIEKQITEELAIEDRIAKINLAQQPYRDWKDNHLSYQSLASAP